MLSNPRVENFSNLDRPPAVLLDIDNDNIDHFDSQRSMDIADSPRPRYGSRNR